MMNANLLHILFEGKNKGYGAYELRKTYNKRIAIAITVMFSICIVISIGQLLASDKGKGKNIIAVKDVSLIDLRTQEKIPEPLRVPNAKGRTSSGKDGTIYSAFDSAR